MAAEGEDTEHLFELMTQAFYDPGVEELPEVDQLLSQVPLPSNFDFADPLGAADDNDRDVDELFSQVPLPNDTDVNQSAGRCSNQETGPSGQRFGPLVSDSDISSLQKTAVCANTKKNTTWAVNVWNEWVDYRRQQNPLDYPPYLLTMTLAEMDKWLSRFVLEVRRKDGNVYPPNTIHQLCCGILRHVQDVKPDLDIFKNPALALSLYSTAKKNYCGRRGCLGTTPHKH